MKFPFSISCFVIILLLIASSSFAVSVDQLNSIPLAFTLNEGQAHSSIRFTAQGSGCGMAFSPTGTTFLLSRETPASVAKRAAKKSVVFEDDPTRNQPEYESFALKLAFVGANENPRIQGEDRLSWNNNYFIGNDPDKWHTDVPNYKKIRLTEVYDGIDLVYYGNQKRVKYDFVVKPGEDPNRILLKYDFGDSGGSLAVNGNGELVVKTPVGELVEKKPYCYQKIDGKEVEVEVRYEVVSGGMYRFRVGEYDGKYDLVIDPEVVFSTYLGGGADDQVDDIAVDSDGYAYVTGFTGSSGPGSADYPVTPGAYDTSFHTLFVSKLNTEGTAFIYSTFLGNGDFPKIAIDGQGNAYIAGTTNSSDYPITENAIDKEITGNGGDAFVTKLNSTGNELIFSTLFGGSRMEYTLALSLDANGNIYIAGYTFSTDYITTSGAYKQKMSDSHMSEVFVTKLNSDASNVLYSTYVGYGEATDIQVNSSGDVYISGNTHGTSDGSSDYPLTDNAFDKIRPSTGKNKLFITKMNNTLSGLVYSTLLGGTADHASYGLALDSSDCAYVCGYTTSTDFPTTPGAIMTSTASFLYCGFVSKISKDGGKLEYSTLLTGEKNNTEYTDTRILDIVIYGDGYAVIAGQTNSQYFPVTANSFSPENNDSHEYDNNAILAIISKDGKDFVYSTLWGGSSHDEAITLALDNDHNNIYIAGQTNSKDFPLSSRAIDTTNYNPNSVPLSYDDGFVSKFHFDSIISGISSETNIPSAFRIVSTYPNPFNPSTTIEFSLPEPGKIKLTVYSITGQKIYGMQTGRLPAGRHQLRWNGKDSMNKAVSSGSYLIRLENGRESVAQKVLFMK